MRLTKNEKRVLKLLLENSKLSDVAIANKMNISSQATGRIRKRLESELIKGYTLNLDLSKLGINIITTCKIEITPEGLEFGIDKIEKKILENSNVVVFCRLPGGETSHTAICAFRDMKEVDDFFHSSEICKEIGKYIKFKSINSINAKRILRNSAKNLISKVVDELGTKSFKMDF